MGHSIEKAMWCMKQFGVARVANVKSLTAKACNAEISRAQMTEGFIISFYVV